MSVDVPRLLQFFAGYANPYFKGKVVSYDAELGYYLVVYEDGDEEECDENELADIVTVLPVECPEQQQTIHNNSKDYSMVIPRPNLSLTKSACLCLYTLHGLQKKDSSKMKIKTGGLLNINTTDKSRVAEFFLFVSERQRVWERRNRGDLAPWSSSPIFQQFSWCNNYRELDRGTQFFRAYVLDLLDDYAANF